MLEGDLYDKNKSGYVKLASVWMGTIVNRTIRASVTESITFEQQPEEVLMRLVHLQGRGFWMGRITKARIVYNVASLLTQLW